MSRTAPCSLTNQGLALQRRTGMPVDALKPQYIAPVTVNMPFPSKARRNRSSTGYSPPSQDETQEELHQPVPLYPVEAGVVPLPAGGLRHVVMDGFKLLEASGMGFPEDARAAVLSDRMFNAVVEDDLSFFTGLLKLDVSENRLKLNYFSALPRLKELRIACNMIRSVEALNGFLRLQSLDLSYNALSMDSLRQLYHIPHLRELDLCGNELHIIPDDFHNFLNLEKLLLEHNLIKDSYVFEILGKMPRLREVTLAYNSLNAVPLRAIQEGNFKLLESLSLAFNFFGSDDSVAAAIQLPRLLLLTLYGNPLLGPSGEDSSGVYVEDLYELSDQVERTKYPNRHLKILSSIPRKMGAINHLKPKNTYEDVELVKVPNSYEPKLNREYRKAGGDTLFATAYKKAKLDSLDAVPLNPPEQDDGGLAFPVSTTFLTTGYTGPEMAGVEAIAENVMDKVVSSLGLNSAASLLDMQDAAASFMRLKVDEDGAVPADLFGRQMESIQNTGSASTIRALKFALKHPLTNDRVVKMGNYARPTVATISQRFLNRSLAMQRSLSQSQREEGGGNDPVFLADTGLFSRRHGSDARDDANQPITNKLYSHGFSRERTRKYRGIRPGGDIEGTPMNVTLKQIDEVLSGLNEVPVAERMSPGSRAMRQSMRRMDRGLKSLINTANAVATDLFDDP